MCCPVSWRSLKRPVPVGMGMPMMIHSDTPAAQQSVWSRIMRVLLFKAGGGMQAQHFCTGDAAAPNSTSQTRNRAGSVQITPHAGALACASSLLPTWFVPGQGCDPVPLSSLCFTSNIVVEHCDYWLDSHGRSPEHVLCMSSWAPVREESLHMTPELFREGRRPGGWGM